MVFRALLLWRLQLLRPPLSHFAGVAWVLPQALLQLVLPLLAGSGGFRGLGLNFIGDAIFRRRNGFYSWCNEHYVR